MTADELNLLLKPEVKEFIKLHLLEDPATIALKYKADGIPIKAVAEQIHCRKKADKKLPTLSKLNLIYEKIALEQASGEVAAEYKSSLISGKRIIDITGGLGIDSYFFSKKFEEVIYCEQNAILSEIFKINSAILGVKNILIKTGDGIEILSSYPDKYFDWVYVDPSRRSEGRRFIGLKYYSPDVVAHLETLLSKAENVLIKISPAAEIEELKKVFKKYLTVVQVISVDGECKEILLILCKTKTFTENALTKAVVLSKNMHYNIYEKNIEEVRLCEDIPKYFYEPDPAIIKGRLTGQLAEECRLCFINPEADYLCADHLLENFPGRKFEILSFISYKDFRSYLLGNGLKKANISRRDFPDSPETIKKKYKIMDGGEHFFFFTKDKKSKLIAIHCRKLENNGN